MFYFNNLSEIKAGWTDNLEFKYPDFPILYFECPFAVEMRGFLELEDLIGDVDFVGYKLRGDDIIIDSLGVLYKLGFERFVVPIKVEGQLDLDSIFKYVDPCLKRYNDQSLINELYAKRDIKEIIEMLANKFSW
jgi:hypothetical protein